MGTVLVIIAVVAVVIGVGVAAYRYQQQRSDQLQERFGPEYERTLDESGDRRSAERDLRSREKRMAKLDVRPLTGEASARYRDEWDSLQSGFVDEPGKTVQKADRLVARMMRERGYPVDSFDQRADDISVDHPEVAQHYRSAHEVATAHSRGTADTEQLRRAVTSYRRLVVVLLDDGSSAHEGADVRGSAADRAMVDDRDRAGARGTGGQG